MSKDLPPVPAGLDANLRRLLQRMRESIQAGLPASSGDGGTTVIVTGGGSGGGGGSDPDPTPPPTPGDLAIVAGLTQVIVSWSGIGYTAGHGNKQCVIYAVKQNPEDDPQDPPTFPGDAGIVAVAPHALTLIAIPSEPYTRWHVWAKFETNDGYLSTTPAGGTNGVQATTALDVDALLVALTGKITRSQLYSDLGDPIDSIPGLQQQYTVKIDNAGHVAGFGLATTAVGATPTSAFGVRADSFWIAPSAYSSATAPTTNLFKGYVWRDTSVSPAVTRYWTGSAWTTTPQNLPFVVQTTTWDDNGYTRPPGVFMDAAFISNLVAIYATIGSLVADDIAAADIAVSQLTAGSLQVGSYIQSTDYTSGPTGVGYKIGPTTIELPPTSIRGKLTANQVDARGLSIYKSDGTLVLDAGDTLDSQVRELAAFAALRKEALANALLVGARLNAGGDVGDAISDAQANLDTKLSKTSNDILGAVVSVNAVSAPAGFRAGTLTWNNAGTVTGGAGVAMTPAGIVGHNGTKTTFAVSASTGNAVFGGDLDAAGGTFAGALSAASGTFAGSLSAATGTFAGALSAATGTFAGTLTAAAVNAVDTINLAGNSVTIPTGAMNSGTSFTSETTICSASAINSTGAPIMVIAEINAPVSAVGELTVTIRVKLGGSTVRTISISGTDGINVDRTIVTYVASPASGSLTPSVTMECSAGSGIADCSLYAIQTKR